MNPEVRKAEAEEACAQGVEPIDAAEAAAPQVVKCACHFAPGAAVAPALYFSRQPVPWGEGPLWHHIGVYAYRRTALDRFDGIGLVIESA